MKREENQTVEYKEAWHEKYLEWNCGNADYNCMKRTPTFASDTFFTVTLPSLTYGLTKDQLVASLMPPVVPPVVTPVVTPVATPVATPVVTPVMTPVKVRVDRALSDRQKAILCALSERDLASSELVATVGGIPIKNLRRRYLRYLLDVGYVAYTVPDKPNSRSQKYRLTPDGKRQLAALQTHPVGEGHETINETIKSHEAIRETINETINETIKSHPGISRAELISVSGKSRSTVARAVSELVKVGRVEYRGSKKTGGYYCWGE